MTTAQLSAIEQHGRNLLAIFPNATERDPVKLCKKLRRIEAEGAAFALRLCNGPEFESEEAQDAEHCRILDKARAILGKGGPTIFLNQDPRGYALKIHDGAARNLVIHKDWGGYGIIAPEINEKGE